MKLPGLIFMVFVLVCSGYITGCENKKTEETRKDITAKDVKKEAHEAAETTIAYTGKMKDEYQKQIEQKLEKYDIDIEELRRKAAGLKKEAKADIGQGMRELKKKRDAAGRKLDELKASGDKAWEDVKKGTDRAMDELAESFDRALSRFK